MKNMWIFCQPKRFAVLLALLLTLSCAPGTSAPQPASPFNVTPYASTAFSLSPVSTIALTATEIPIPTPTPFTYTVARGDTLSTIAERFGIRLDDLLVANPGIIAEALSVGQTLKIPSGSPASAANPASTPAPLNLGAPACYPSGAGLYCIVPAQNPYPEPLENVKLQITLLDSAGQALASQEAFLPLDILPPGGALPAYTFFPLQSPDFHPFAQLLNSTRLLPNDSRYLPAQIRNLLVSVDWDGRSARVQGQVFLPAGTKPAGTIWLVAVAYDVNDQITGFRRWEWTGSLQPGGTQSFDFPVSSFGQVIEKVKVVMEARR